MKSFAVIIPAVKKNVAFPDDLVKKLGGKMLVQRTIDTARELVPFASHIFIATDSQEISLIGERAKVSVLYKKELRLESSDLIKGLRLLLAPLCTEFRHFLFLHPYCPTISPSLVKEAMRCYLAGKADSVISVRHETQRLFSEDHATLMEAFSRSAQGTILAELKAFLIVKGALISQEPSRIRTAPFVLPTDTVEIRSYQDWWICEKLLNRKRIVFRVVGSVNVGMGHVFRALSVAHEITDHEILFVCDETDNLAYQTVSGQEYLVESLPSSLIERRILELKPDLVINDMLNTTAEYVQRLQKAKIKVVNFEDIGTGAGVADITFNELYEKKTVLGSRIRWGNSWLFLRDEFVHACRRRFRTQPENLLITFGGTDARDLTGQTLKAVLDICQQRNIRIFLVTGAGYPHEKKLKKFIETCGYDRIEFTSATGIMSKIMEQADLAVCSNGRTVYEIAYMRIPAVVISQNVRETIHFFPSAENGFVNLGLFDPDKTLKRVRKEVLQLLSDNSYRYNQKKKMHRFDFLRNKPKVLRLIQGLLKQP